MILPNQLTILRIILTPIFYFLFISDDQSMKLISVFVFFIAAITDWYDGWLARKFNYITNWGKFLDPLADKILTSAAFIALVKINVLELWMVLIIIIRDFLITGLRAYADYKGELFNTSFLAKWKTLLQMIFLYYLLFIEVLLSSDLMQENYKWLNSYFRNKEVIYFVMLAITLLTFFTGYQYFIQNKKLIRKLFLIEN